MRDIDWIHGKMETRLIGAVSDPLNSISSLPLSLSPSVEVINSNQTSLSIHRVHPMDLSVTQRLLHPGTDPAMLAPRSHFFLGSLASQHCPPFSQQHSQVSVRRMLLYKWGGTYGSFRSTKHNQLVRILIIWYHQYSLHTQALHTVYTYILSMSWIWRFSFGCVLPHLATFAHQHISISFRWDRARDRWISCHSNLKSKTAAFSRVNAQQKWIESRSGYCKQTTFSAFHLTDVILDQLIVIQLYSRTSLFCQESYSACLCGHIEIFTLSGLMVVALFVPFCVNLICIA